MSDIIPFPEREEDEHYYYACNGLDCHGKRFKYCIDGNDVYLECGLCEKRHRPWQDEF